MKQSAFGNYDNRTAHEIFCDYEIAKFRRPLKSVKAKVGRNPQLKRYDYSNYELKEIFKKMLDK